MASLISEAVVNGSRSATKIDYEHKLWGAHEVEPTPKYLGGLKLKYCLEDLEGVTGKVLEIGCGGGAMTRAIKRYRPDLQVHGLDLSVSALSVAKHAHGGVSYGSGDAHRLPIVTGSYDAVVMLDVLEHLPDPQSALKEVHRILTPHGVFHLNCPLEGDIRNLHGILHRFGWRAKEDLIGHVQLFTDQDLRNQLRSFNFLVGKARWSTHGLNQIADIAYFTWRDRSKHTIQTSIEGYLESRDEADLSSTATKFAKVLFAAATFYESLVFEHVPGAGISMSLEKRSEN